jgi:hypothetical protein
MFGTLFHYDAGNDEWSEVKVSGEKLPGTKCDASGMCYDSKRDRLVLTGRDFRGDLIAVDLKSLAAARLAPKGMADAASAGLFHRETCYDEVNDLVIVLTKNSPSWPVYDCAKNAWTDIAISGTGDGNRGASAAGAPKWDGCSNGLMYDPLRRLVLMVDANSVIYALCLDPQSGKAGEPK